MKQTIFLALFFITSFLGMSQNIYQATSGEISFFSKTPVEDIDAVNKKVKGIVNTETNKVAFVATIIGFHFKKPLMEEHFNENYMESDKYKTAVFKGEITSKIDYKKNGEYDAIANGLLNIHGVEKEREITGKIIVKDGKFTLQSKFNVLLKDHNIKIPKLVIKNIAETVEVKVDMSFEPKK